MKLPFFDELDKAQNILLAGAGGGFDVFCGLPLYFRLRSAGKTVHLANLSFTNLKICDGERPVPSLVVYREACEFVFARMPHHPSIVNTSIIAAVQGWFGDRHPTSRTAGSELFINPLMALCWAFQLDHVARRNLYLDCIRDTQTYEELSLAIEDFRTALPREKPRRDIPC